MITCGNCGSGIADDAVFCGQCGAPRPDGSEFDSDAVVEPVPVLEQLEPEQVIDPESEIVDPDYPPPPFEYQPNERSNTCLWIVLGCLFLFLVLLCILIVIFAFSLTAFSGLIEGLF